MLGDTFSFKDKRHCHRHPGCSDSSCFIDVFFRSRVDISRRYWPNFCTAVLCHGTAWAMGYGQGMIGAWLYPARVGAHRLAGLCHPWLGAVPPRPNKLSRAGLGPRTRDSWGPVITTWSHIDKTGPGVHWAVSLWVRVRGLDQWDPWPGAGIVITQLQHSSGRGQGQQSQLKAARKGRRGSVCWGFF